MRNLTSLIAAGLLLAGCSMHSGSYQLRASGDAPVARVEKSARVQFPFPPGDWTLLYSRDGEGVPSASPGFWTNIKATRRVYGRVVGSKIVEMIQFRANTTGNGAPFGISPECTQGDASGHPLYVADVNGGQGSWSCLTADVRTFSGPSKHSSDLDDALYAATRPYGGIPKVSVHTELVAGYQDNFLSVSIYRFPSLESVQGKWRPGAETPEERAWVQARLDEDQAFRAKVIRAARNKL